EQEQQEKFDRMALQAKELEDRLERFSGSMRPSLDPKPTQVRGTPNPQWAADSLPARSVGPGKQMIVDFSPKRKGPPPLLYIGAAVVVLFLAGVGITAYLMLRPGTRTGDPTPTPTPVAPPKAKADLLPIAGGTFLMGRQSG